MLPIGDKRLDSGGRILQGFRAQGGSSLAAARIANIYAQLGIPVSRVVKLLLDETHTVGDAASHLHTESLTSPANPEEDAQLPDDIAPVSAPSGGTRVLKISRG